MALTFADVEHFVVLAGPDYMYSGVVGSSRPPSTYRDALRMDMLERQGGLCVVCGTANPLLGAWEFNHVVSAGPLKRGFIPKNAFCGHSSCNARTKPVHDKSGTLISGVAVLTPDMLARPDLVPEEWTSPVILKARTLALRASR